MIDFFRGLSAVPSGFRMLLRAGLRPYVWLPIVINVLVFTALLWFGYSWLQDLLAGWLPQPGAIDTSSYWGAAYHFLVVAALWLLLPLYLLASVVIGFFSFTLVANLISSPFNGMLSARVEQQLAGRFPPGVAGRGLVVEAVGAIGDELRKILYFAKWGVPLFILSFVPVINLVIAPLFLLYGTWVVTLEYMDYPLGNRDLDFATQRRVVRERLAYHLGFGAGILAMTVIPGLNLLAMPTGVIAATIARQRLDAPEPTPLAEAR